MTNFVQTEIPATLPVFALREGVLFPLMILEIVSQKGFVFSDLLFNFNEI